MPEISIIVPVYRTEQYLNRCVDSILQQTITDLELILVDDGSPDHCPEICDQYAASDSRVKVIHKKNEGVSIARNCAIKEASGTYIGFVDSDDWILPEMYQEMLLAASKTGAEIVMCDLTSIFDDGKTESDTITQLSGDCILTKDTLTPKLMLEFAGSACRCIYSNNLLKEKEILFPQGIKLSEDRIFNIQAMGCTNYVCYLKKEFYFRYMNRESAVHRFHPDAFEQAKMAQKATKNAIENVWKDDAYQVAYLRQFVEAAINSINNLHHEHSMFSRLKKIGIIKQICADQQLREAIALYGYGGEQGELILERCVFLLYWYEQLAETKIYWILKGIKRTYNQNGVTGVIRKCMKNLML